MASIGIKSNIISIVTREQLPGIDDDIDIICLPGHDAFIGRQGDISGIQFHDVTSVNPDSFYGHRTISVHQSQDMSTIGTSRGHQEFSPFRVLCKAILLIKEPVIQKNGQLTFVRAFPEINGNTRPRKAIP